MLENFQAKATKLFQYQFLKSFLLQFQLVFYVIISICRAYTVSVLKIFSVLVSVWVLLISIFSVSVWVSVTGISLLLAVPLDRHVTSHSFAPICDAAMSEGVDSDDRNNYCMSSRPQRHAECTDRRTAIHIALVHLRVNKSSTFLPCSRSTLGLSNLFNRICESRFIYL